MRRFKTKIKKSNHSYLLIVILLVVLLIFFINVRANSTINDIVSTKLEEYANLIVKREIVPKNVESEKLVKLYFNDKREIIYSDINMEYANSLMIDVVEKIQNSLNDLFINDELLTKYKDIYFIRVPVSLGKYFTFTSNLSPKIPIKINYYEHSFGNVDLELIDYGINNAMLKVYLTIDLEQKVYIPYNRRKFRKQYKLLIASSLINGTVPNIYGGKMTKSSSII